MAGRLRSIMDAECIQCHELLCVLVEIRREKLLPEDATLCLILDEVRSTAETCATQAVGHPEDFEDLCQNRVDELAAKLTDTIEEYVRANPLPALMIENAINTATEQFDRSIVGQTYRERYSKQYAQDVRRYLTELGCPDIVNMLDTPKALNEQKQNAERLLTGKTNLQKELEDFKASIELDYQL